MDNDEDVNIKDAELSSELTGLNKGIKEQKKKQIIIGAIFTFILVLLLIIIIAGTPGVGIFKPFTIDS